MDEGVNGEWFDKGIRADVAGFTADSVWQYIGGTSYPLALEGALKLKEISYIHAEGYAAGELKHGPIALVDQDMPVIVIAPNDAVLDKTISNMQEVAARGGRLILIGDARLAHDFANEAATTIVMQDFAPEFAAMVYAVPVQLIPVRMRLRPIQSCARSEQRTSRTLLPKASTISWRCRHPSFF
jgi:glucosamine 6-phosphate synthetase-like amidotransferase/phosphosugar isomerase protein